MSLAFRRSKSILALLFTLAIAGCGGGGGESAAAGAGGSTGAGAYGTGPAAALARRLGEPDRLLIGVGSGGSDTTLIQAQGLKPDLRPRCCQRRPAA